MQCEQLFPAAGILSCDRSAVTSLKNSKKAIKDTKCDAVKIEGGVRVKNIVRHLVKYKIPVLGHIGITPQTEKGKFKSKGKNEIEKKKLIEDAQALEQSGAFGIVLECVYGDISKYKKGVSEHSKATFNIKDLGSLYGFSKILVEGESLLFKNV